VFDLLGVSLAWGDFDGDGFDDLAMGAFGEDVDGVDFAGAVHVLYGSPNGLRAIGDQRWTQNSSDIANDAEDSDQFGQALAAGDFDGDGFDDLAIGVWRQSIGGVDLAGAVHVLYGSHAGLRATNSQFWHQNRTGILGDAEYGDQFGGALAAGDFNGDGFADLAVGAPGQSINGHAGAGAVQVLYGSHNGLRASHNQIWSQDSPGIGGTAQDGDGFGTVLKRGDFNGDGFDDLAIGIPGKDVAGAIDSGAIAVIYGSESGLRTTADQQWSESTSGLSMVSDAGDNFGAAMAVGDFDHDGRDDLAIGIRNKTVDGVPAAGAVLVLFGTHHGLKSASHQLLTQNSPGIADAAEDTDRFGFSLSSADFDGDGFADLAIGVPYEDIDGVENAGAVQILFGKSTGLGVVGDQFLDQQIPGVGDEIEAGDEFGDYM